MSSFKTSLGLRGFHRSSQLIKAIKELLGEETAEAISAALRCEFDRD